METLFRCLSQSSKSPLSAIRSAVEALIGYPEMAPEKRDAFQKIIYQESLTLTAILDRLADECAGLVGYHRAPDGDGPILPVPEIGGKLNGPDAAVVCVNTEFQRKMSRTIQTERL